MSDPVLSVIDVETTGFAYKSHDRIVEIGIVKTRPDGTRLDEFETLIDPQRDVGPTEVHGITAEMVLDAPTFTDVYETVLEFLDGSILVAHNAAFDVNFLRAELDRMGESLTEPPHICTLHTSRQVFSDASSFKLERLCDYLDIELKQAHSALHDARATSELFERLVGQDPGVVSTVSDVFAVDRDLSGESPRILTRSEFEQIQVDRDSPLGAILERLPSVEAREEGEQAYAEMLDEILMDRIVSDEELDSLLSLANDYGINQEQAQSIHRDYLKHLVRYALLDDVITDREREDIERVQQLLGLGEHDLDAIIEDVRDSLESTYEDDFRARHRELEGKTVCFTGSLTGRLDGESISRSQAQKMAEERGMNTKSNVTKDLDYLVAADPHSQSNKAEKARRYENVTIVAEPKFWEMLRVNVE